MFACKLYPAGATTNSDNGVTDIKKVQMLTRNESARRLSSRFTSLDCCCRCTRCCERWRSMVCLCSFMERYATQVLDIPSFWLNPPHFALLAQVTDSCIDLFDREAVFVETILKPLVCKLGSRLPATGPLAAQCGNITMAQLKEMPNLRVVMEHITTKVGQKLEQKHKRVSIVDGRARFMFGCFNGCRKGPSSWQASLTMCALQSPLTICCQFPSRPGVS